ncbi:MAG TPA: 2Fe-2S iron-sulfur cluster-binding protein [Thermoanaerobaculia bacterium]|nr:2Fe-2S iron-sulfur cluster-binding protein [Thermoanaerobaculia bacterium]
MPKVTINDRTVEVEAGTNLIEAGIKVGVQIPHYCYHPRLTVVGQCRMCLVEVSVNGKKMPKLQAGCSTPVADNMEVRTDTDEVRDAQAGMMEFFLINHPLDCPICDQAGECGLQDYSFKHGVAFSRFKFEDKRTYPGRERIPLGPNVILNMNRCIQCTRCVRFTHEVSQTGELGFFNRGARTEIGTFPGKELDNPLSTCVVDICPVGALTSTRFRFAERVFYLDKKPSICTGCDVGCNITMEHRRGNIKRYKPRFNPEVNDYWMCDYGRSTFERYKSVPRLRGCRVRSEDGTETIGGWKEALDLVHRRLRQRTSEGAVAFLGSGNLTNEEAWLFSLLASYVGSPHRGTPVDLGAGWTIPNLKGGITGTELAPNRRGAEMLGMRPSAGEELDETLGGDGSNGKEKAPVLDQDELLLGDGASKCAVLVVCDSDFGRGAYTPEVVERLRRAKFLVVFGWADSPLAKVADVALPVATHAEKDGTFVNAEWRVQRFVAAFPAPAQVRSTVEALSDLLGRFDPKWAGLTPEKVFDRIAADVPAFVGLKWSTLPATGAALQVPGANPIMSETTAETMPEVS